MENFTREQLFIVNLINSENLRDEIRKVLSDSIKNKQKGRNYFLSELSKLAKEMANRDNLIFHVSIHIYYDYFGEISKKEYEIQNAEDLSNFVKAHESNTSFKIIKID